MRSPSDRYGCAFIWEAALLKQTWKVKSDILRLFPLFISLPIQLQIRQARYSDKPAAGDVVRGRPPLYSRTGIPSKNLEEQREKKSQRPLTEHSVHLWRINTERLSHSRNLTSPDSPQMYQHQIFIFLWVPSEWRTWMRESKENRGTFKEWLWKACRERPAS